MQVGLSPGSPPPDITVIQLQKPELLWLETQEIPSVGPSWKCLTPASCREHCREEGAAIWLQCLGQQISALLQIILPWDGFPSKSHLGWLQREMEGGVLFVVRMSVLTGRRKVFLHLGTGQGCGASDVCALSCIHCYVSGHMSNHVLPPSTTYSVPLPVSPWPIVT